MWTEIGGVSRVTEACDWWSLGALLFELLTGMVSEGVVRNFFFFFAPFLHICGIGFESCHTLRVLCQQPLWQLHPAGIHSHTQLIIPNHLSAAAASLLTEVFLLLIITLLIVTHTHTV